MVSATTDRRLGLAGNTAYKVPATVVATANISLSGEQTIDGVSVLSINAAGFPDRVLAIAQTDARQNGLWDVNTGQWTRSVDANGNYDLTNGTQVQISRGAVNARSVYALTTLNPIIVGTTAQTWTPFTPGTAGLVFFDATANYAVGTIGWEILNRRVNPKSFPWSAKFDGVTDDSAAISAARAWLEAAGGGVLELPRGTFRCDSGITITAGKVIHIRGEGPGATIMLVNSATGDGIVSSHPSFVTGGSISGLSIIAGSAATNTGDGSSGTGIKVRGANGDFQIDNVDVRCFATGISNDGSFYLRLTNFQILYCKSYGIRVPQATSGSAGAGSSYINGKISNFGYTGAGTTHIGVSVEESGGDYWSFIDITSFSTGRQIKPPAGKQVSYQFFVNVLSDTSTNDGTVIDGTLGAVVSIEMIEDWTAFSTNGSGMVIKGSGVDSVNWSGRARENGKHGIHIQGGTNVHLSPKEIARNSKLSTLTYDGVHVDANVSDWSVVGGRIGNFASGLAHEQADGVHIDAGTSQNFRIVGVDLRTPGTGKVAISNGSSSLNFSIQGNLPIQSAGTNQERGGAFSSSSLGTIAGGLTRYLGFQGAQATEGDAYMVYGRPAVISQLIVQVDTAPGAGQSFTYTLRVNGVDTSMTGAISGGSSFQVVLTNAQLIAGTDTVSLKVVTSAGAAAARHRWVINADA